MTDMGMPYRALLLWALLMAGSCGSPLVGGTCREETLECDGQCVDPRADPAHCGSCGNDCGAFTCVSGRCTTDLRPDLPPDASVTLPDGAPVGLDAGTTPPENGREAGTGLGGTGFPLSPDGGFFGFDRDATAGDGGLGCPLGESACAGGCFDLDADVEHCGGCGQACDQGEVCSGGRCLPDCEPPLIRCGRACFDSQQDPRHCGGCNDACTSGVCEAGECADAVPGQLAVIGHDFRQSNPAMQRLAGNALFLASGAPVRTLVYRGDAVAGSVRGVEQAFGLVEREDGRQWQQLDADPDRVAEQLGGVDAFVVHAQAGASDAELATLGSRWGLALAQFLVTGGVVVLFETSSEDNAGTFQILQSAGTFTAAGRERLGSQRLSVPEAGVGLAVLVPTNGYQSAETTVRFLDPDPAARVVVEDGDGEAVVLHRIVSP